MRSFLLLALLLPAAASASPARPGDFSLGGGAGLLIDRSEAGPSAVAEANLLWSWLSLGLRLRGAAIDGELRPSAGVEFGALGLVGIGAALQEPGVSIDGLLQLPIPIYGPGQSYFTLGYRPSWLVEGGGWIHEIALQLKWSSLLGSDFD